MARIPATATATIARPWESPYSTLVAMVGQAHNSRLLGGGLRTQPANDWHKAENSIDNH